ncbi:hypothetical protein GCM10020331_082760 [Ectobacillus funiculus]
MGIKAIKKLLYPRDKRDRGNCLGLTCNNMYKLPRNRLGVRFLKTKKGKSTIEIRNYIDTKYKEGFAKPTPTPMPQ